MPDRTAGSSATTTERALRAIRDLRAKVDVLERRQGEPVAIVGMGCRFPGAADLSGFWDLLVRGADPLGPVPQDRWNIDSLYNPDPQARGKTVSREGGYLPNLDRFDADFFGITPREAPFIDPRQRLVLETAWEALEDAGIPADRLAGSLTSVVVGTLTNDYNQLITADDRWVSAATGTGTSNSIIANRLSYVLDLHGPSLTVDTACSGSLLALHLACQTLRNGEATVALCGGVAVNLVPAPDICFSRMGALSPRGRCHTFDAASDGMARSEGAGMVVLKLLSQAEADGDRIYALIRASAVNHDGRSNGIAAPNGQAQERLLREAYGKAGIAPGRVQYVEAHGTGTIVGDRIELQALANVLGTDRAPGYGCAVGSVKSNIGHTESAAGIAGIMKTALALKHRLLPGNPAFRDPPSGAVGSALRAGGAHRRRTLSRAGGTHRRRSERLLVRRGQCARDTGGGAGRHRPGCCRLSCRLRSRRRPLRLMCCPCRRNRRMLWRRWPGPMWPSCARRMRRGSPTSAPPPPCAGPTTPFASRSPAPAGRRWPPGWRRISRARTNATWWRAPLSTARRACRWPSSSPGRAPIGWAWAAIFMPPRLPFAR